MFEFTYKSLKINLPELSVTAINAASEKWARDYKSAHENDTDDFPELKNTTEWGAGQSPENAFSFITNEILRLSPAAYYSLYPIQDKQDLFHTLLKDARNKIEANIGRGFIILPE